MVRGIKFYTESTQSHEFDIKDDDGNPETMLLIVAKNKNGDIVAKAYFGYHPDAGQNVCWQIFVDEGYRRKGIATAMYNLAEERYGEKTVPFPGGHSRDARRFWEARGGRDRS